MRSLFWVSSFAVLFLSPLVFGQLPATHLIPLTTRTLAEGQAPKSQLIKRSKRTQLLHESGLEKDVSGLDELDKDFLVLGASQKSLGELAGKYPQLSKEKLQKLQQLVREIQ